MKRHFFRLSFSLVFGLLQLLLFAGVASTDTAQPDTTPSIDEIDIYQYLLEDGDMMIVASYTVYYASPPEAGIDNTFIFRFLDTDGTTELGSILAYPYYNGGYGVGVVSFYFSADDAPTWEEIYFIAITENPAAFDEPIEWKFAVSTIDYSSFDTQEENQQLLRDKVLELADELSSVWPVELTEEAETGKVLSSYGESYFRTSIRGIQSICPDLFYIQISNIDMTTRDWDYTFANYLTATYEGTIVWSAMAGFAGLWGLKTTTASSFFSIVFVVVVASLIIKRFRQLPPGYLFACLALLYTSCNGWFSPILHALFSFMFVLVGGLVLFQNKA